MSNLPYFPGVLYFGAASCLFAFGSRGRSLVSRPRVLRNLLRSLAGHHHAPQHSRRQRRKWLNNVSALGSIISALRAAHPRRTSHARFGPATHFSLANLMPHWSLGNAIFWSSVFSHSAASSPAPPWAMRSRTRGAPSPGLSLSGRVLAVGYISGTFALLVACPARLLVALTVLSLESMFPPRRRLAAACSLRRLERCRRRRVVPVLYFASALRRWHR